LNISLLQVVRVVVRVSSMDIPQVVVVQADLEPAPVLR
jgi:hypothetical protein